MTRTASPALDALLGTPIPLLDHGHIVPIDYMGDDAAIVQAARVSYGEGTRTVSDDTGLIRYLMRHRHSTPFEMAELKILVKCPIFVARQWMRHRSGSFNEVSGRYSVLPEEFYVPEAENMAAQSTTNKQGRGEVLEPWDTEEIGAHMRHHPSACFEAYSSFLETGLSRELARTVLPLSTYTQFYWKTNLHNLLHFLALRADPHAQYEIRVYAEALLEIVKAWVPITYRAFLDYRVNAVTLSAGQIEVMRRWLSGDTAEGGDYGLSKREWRELDLFLSPRAD